MKIVVLDGDIVNPGDISWAPLERYGDLIVHERRNSAPVEELIGDADIVIVIRSMLDEAVFKARPGIKYISMMATGYDNVDVGAARRHGIPVSNLPDYGTDGVAEMVFALLLALCRGVAAFSSAVKSGGWASDENACLYTQPIFELGGKTMGIIGFGKIGKRAAEIAQAFGMNVLAYSRRRESVEETDTLKYAALDDLLAQSDVVSLHCPLSAQTRHIIDADAIAKMKDGAMLINTSRGGLIDEPALRDALNSGKLGGAGCDVVSVEPLSADSALLDAKNIFITPHVAWASRRTRQRLITKAAENVEAYIAGRLINVVN